MAYFDLGADQVPAQASEKLTGKEAANLAGPRLRYVGSQLMAMHDAIEALTYYKPEQVAQAKLLAAKVNSLAKRTLDWENQVVAQDPRSGGWALALPAGTAVATGGLSLIGAGLLRIGAEVKGVVTGTGTPGAFDLQGVEWLNTVLRFELEANALCKEVQALTGRQITTCKPLPPPQKPVPQPSVLGGLGGLLKWGIVGLGVYFGGRALLTYLQHSSTVPKSERPGYLKGKVS